MTKPRIESPEAFEAMALAYVEQQEFDRVPRTLRGLAYALGLKTREELHDYTQDEGLKEFRDTALEWINKCRANGGRSRIVANAEEFEARAVDYFESRLFEELPLLITGLTLHLGFNSKASFYQYKDKEEFKAVAEWSALCVEQGYEGRLASGMPAAGMTFALKNMGWQDPQRLDLGNADDKPFEMNDTARAARLASLVAIAQGRKTDKDNEDLC